MISTAQQHKRKIEEKNIIISRERFKDFLAIRLLIKAAHFGIPTMPLLYFTMMSKANVIKTWHLESFGRSSRLTELFLFQSSTAIFNKSAETKKTLNEVRLSCRRGRMP